MIIIFGVRYIFVIFFVYVIIFGVIDIFVDRKVINLILVLLKKLINVILN